MMEKANKKGIISRYHRGNKTFLSPSFFSLEVQLAVVSTVSRSQSYEQAPLLSTWNRRASPSGEIGARISRLIPECWKFGDYVGVGQKYQFGGGGCRCQTRNRRWGIDFWRRVTRVWLHREFGDLSVIG